MKTKLTAIMMAMLPAFAATSSQPADPEMYDNTVIVVYKASASTQQKAQARNSVGARISDANRDEIDDRFKNLMQGRVAQLELRGYSVKQAIEVLKNNAAVAYAEPNYVWKKALTPSDTRYGDLWGLNNTGQNGGTADADIDAAEAWDITTGSRDIVIGVIDTGVDYAHEDLIDNMWINPNEIPNDGIDNDNNGYIDDIYGIDTANGDSDPIDDDAHGTHVSGTIGASGDNGIGVVGVNHQVSIAACKFLGDDGTGSTAGAIECIDYFTALKIAGINIKATNNSWGGGPFSQALKDSISAAGDAGIMFFAAAGNAGTDNDASPHYPSSYDNENLVAVANTNRNDADDGDSFGLTSVDLTAPGAAILSTTPGNTYSVFSGTSMATPHVAGSAALLWSIDPDLSISEMKEILLTSGDDNAWAEGRTVSGKRLNVNNALAMTDPEPSFTLSVSPSSAEIVAGDSMMFEFSVGSLAEWDGEVSLEIDDDYGIASLSTTTAFPGDLFTLDVDTENDTAWGEYSFSVVGTSGDLEKSSTVNLYVLPQGITTSNYPYLGAPVATVPNESDPDDLGLDLTINVPDDLTLFGTEVSVDITHTYSGDLTLTLTSPAGTAYTLRQNTGGATDDIVESYSTPIFNGEVGTGDWVLNVLDSFNGDDGQVNNWSLTFDAVGEVGPTPPVAAFSYVDEGLQVTFTNESTDSNGDIDTYTWDFGDGMSSSETNPIHVFAATGNYDVTLTATDVEGLDDSVTMNISVSDSNITNEIVRAYKSRFGNLRVDLSYAGSSADMVSIYRNGELIAETENTGIYRDRGRRVDGSSFTYMVCDVTTACSEPVTVDF